MTNIGFDVQDGGVVQFERNDRVDFGLSKGSVSPLLNYQMYKILKYERNPKPTVILGDSRSLALEEKFFSQCGIDNVFNLAYGGGTLFEAIDTFWFATEITKLKKVILGIPFSIFNESNSMNRFPAAREVTRNSLSYYLSPLVTKASFLNLLSWLSGNEIVSEKPLMSREDFWNFQLGPGTDRFYLNWQSPEVLWARLVEISEYCQQNSIEMIIFIPPSHVEQQDLISRYNLDSEYAAYKFKLAQLGPVYDYDQRNLETENKDNFLDPHHCIAAFSQKIVNDMVHQAMPTKELDN